MDLVEELEEAFELRLDTSDMLNLTSYEKGKEVLSGYGVLFEDGRETGSV